MSRIREYVYDAAFQKHVVKNALGSDYYVKAFLMMADKGKVADVDGQNQLFKIRKNNEGRTEEVANGGAALTAYNKLMFCDDTKMNDGLRKALLRYCELDTMSMVFILEYFAEATR